MRKNQTGKNLESKLTQDSLSDEETFKQEDGGKESFPGLRKDMKAISCKRARGTER